MLQIYTGDGKGKTTAAIGLAVRAVGAGHRVYIMQFMKSLAYSEQQVLQSLPGVTLKTSGKPFFIATAEMMASLTAEQRAELGDVVVFAPDKPPADYVALIAAGLADARRAITSGEYELVILDELNVALAFGLVTREQVEKLLDTCPATTELVLTGRRAPEWLIERADLVTDMCEVKHYYTQGVAARRGIEN